MRTVHIMTTFSLVTLACTSNVLAQRPPDKVSPAVLSGDSTAIVKAAIAELARLGNPGPLAVQSFTRDSTGTTVELWPAGKMVAGGGGVIRVDKKGVLHVLRLEQ